MGAVNCDSEAQLCASQKIKQYPTIWLYHSHKRYLLNQERTPTGLEAFLSSYKESATIGAIDLATPQDAPSQSRAQLTTQSLQEFCLETLKSIEQLYAINRAGTCMVGFIIFNILMATIRLGLMGFTKN